MEHPSSANYDLVAPARSELDLEDLQAVIRFMHRHNPDVVLHVAGKVGGIQANIANPVEFLTKNWNIGSNILLAAQESRIQRLINIGSSCMYPKNFDGSISEEQILTGSLEPTNEGYALAKIAVQRLCSYIDAADTELQYKTLVPCNLFGRFDNFSTESSHLIAAVIRKIHDAKLNRSKQVVIWGDGTAHREFLYASDFADSIYTGIENFDSLPGTMNIGTGVDYTITEYYEMIAEVIGWHGDFTYDLSQPGGMKRKLLDVSRQVKFGWEPTTSLRAALEKTYQYYLETSPE